jgi:hypothetical protein
LRRDPWWQTEKRDRESWHRASSSDPARSGSPTPPARSATTRTINPERRNLLVLRTHGVMPNPDPATGEVGINTTAQETHLRCRSVRLIGPWCVAGEWWSCSWARRSALTTGVVANCSSKQRVPGGVAMRHGRSYGHCDSRYVAHPLVRTVTRFVLCIPMLVFTTGIRLGGAHRWSPLLGGRRGCVCATVLATMRKKLYGPCDLRSMVACDYEDTDSGV